MISVLDLKMPKNIHESHYYSDCCLMPNEQLFSSIMATSYIWWDDFILEQHAQLDYYSAIWLKQQSVGRNVRHIILIQAN